MISDNSKCIISVRDWSSSSIIILDVLQEIKLVLVVIVLVLVYR